MSQNVILSIDCGTQSMRAILFSPDGEVIDKEQIFYEPYFSVFPGWAEQDPEIYWQSLCNSCISLKLRNPLLFDQITGVGVTTLRNSMVCVGQDGQPLRNIITWLDQRKAREVYFPQWWMKMALKFVGMDEVILKMQKEGKGNWIKQNQPGIWENTYKYLQVSGFLNYRLTGEFTDSVASQIGHVPFDYKKLRWGNPRDLTNFSAKIYPVEPEKLPDLVEPGKIIGQITKLASTLTGIKKGTPVVACGSDKGCETLGTGVVDSTKASLSFGTTATVQTTTTRYLEPIPFMPSYPAVIEGRFNPEVEIFRGFWMVKWFKDEFADKEVREAIELGIVPEDVLNRLLAEAAPGSMGLVVQPFWAPGLSEPIAKGAMIGFGDVHNKAHVYRAIIEGLAYGLREGVEKIEKRGDFRFDKLVVSGGASQSDSICQISADVFNRPVVRGRTYESSGLGAAIITAFGTGIYKSVEEAVGSMVDGVSVFVPDPENSGIYQRLYQNVYQKMYKSLEPFYKEIQEITGYPGK